MKTTSIYLFVTAMACLMFACIKIENKSNPQSKMQLLCKAPWKLSEMTMNDSLLNRQFCELDDIHTLYMNGDWVTTPGVNLCSPADSLGYSFKWALTENERCIVFNPGTLDTASYFIEELNSSRLKLKQRSDFNLRLVFQR